MTVIARLDRAIQKKQRAWITARLAAKPLASAEGGSASGGKRLPASPTRLSALASRRNRGKRGQAGGNDTVTANSDSNE